MLIPAFYFVFMTVRALNASIRKSVNYVKRGTDCFNYDGVVETYVLIAYKNL